MGSTYIEHDVSEVVSAIKSATVITLDLETSGLSPLDSRILLCQIGTPQDQWVINTSSCSVEPILPYLSSYKSKKIIHNAKFEQKFFQYFYKTKINNVFDIYLAEQILIPEGHANGLDDLALKYLNIILDKKTRSSFFNHAGGSFTQQQIDYAARDIQVLYPIMQIQEKAGKELGLEKIFEIEFDLAGVVASMENTGIPIDAALWRDKLREVDKDHEESRIKIHEIIYAENKIDEQLGLFGRDYSLKLGSPKKVKETLHKIGINVKSTDERELSLIKHPVAAELLEYRGLDKSMTSYGNSFLEKIHGFDGRIHPDFQQIGAETGRFSCREPNVQQIPPQFRECVRLDGYQIVTGDYSQIELRILAQMSGDPNLIKAFTSNEDPHKMTASMMFGVPIDAVSKHQRFISKTLNFMIAYGGGITKFRDMMNAEALKNKTPEVSFPQAKTLMNRYYATYKVMNEWLHEAGMSAYREAMSRTLLGRRRTFKRPDPNTMPEKEFEKQVSAIKRQGANHAIQGCSADITKLAMVDVYNELFDSGLRGNIINSVHDEIVVLAQTNQAEGVRSVLGETMKKAAEQVITKVPIQCDAVVSDAWRK